MSDAERPPTLPGSMVWACLLAISAFAFSLTAHWHGVISTDAEAAAAPGWQLAHHHTLWLGETFPWFSGNPWYFHANGHVASNRTPGVIFIGVPMQVLFAPFHTGPAAAATATAVATAAAAVANLGSLLHRSTGDVRLAGASATVFALGTGMWTSAGAELWTHGPDALWLSSALIAVVRRQPTYAGVACAMAVLTRPHLAVAAAILGLMLYGRLRETGPLLRFASASACGLAALVVYNDLTYGHPSLSGGYSYAVSNAVSGAGGTLRPMLASLLGTAMSPLHGVLVYSPIVALGLLAIVVGVRDAPRWTKAAAMSGLGYALVQSRINGFEGGAGYYSYRLPLEALLLAWPLATVAYQAMTLRLPGCASVARALAVVSISVHAIGAVAPPHQPLYSAAPDPWHTWPWEATALGTSIAKPALTVTVVLGILLSRRRWTSSWSLLAPAVTARAPSERPSRPTRGLLGAE